LITYKRKRIESRTKKCLKAKEKWRRKFGVIDMRGYFSENALYVCPSLFVG
jgi:hypothetical protein